MFKNLIFFPVFLSLHFPPENICQAIALPVMWRTNKMGFLYWSQLATYIIACCALYCLNMAIWNV
jgi:hypothetical protein